MIEKKNIVILLVIVILVGIVLIVCFIPKDKSKDNPVDVIESNFNLRIPSTAKIIHFDYGSWNGDIALQVQFSSNDLESIKKELDNYFGEPYEDNVINYNGYGISWWNVDKNNIVVWYQAQVEGKKHLFLPSPKTINYWAFITNEDGQYYLYIAN